VQQGIPIEGGLNARTRDSLGLEWDRQPVKGTEEPEPTPARGNAAQQTTDARRAATEPPRSERERSGTDGDHVRLSALTPEQTKEVQQRLQNLGFYQGPVDGVMGAGTRAAVMRYFQRQAQLAAQGMVDDSAMELFGVRASDVKAEMKTAGAGVIRSERPVQ
jgi:peptidoglycan hydrolase-like protein with peptidoglycan-binding domain